MQPKYYGAAADYRKSGGPGFRFDRKLVMILGGGVVAILFIVIALGLINSAGSAPKNDLETLVAREQAFAAFINENQQSINTSDLKKIAAEGALLITSDQNELTAQLNTQYGVTEVPGDIVTAETDTASAATLKTALASGQFDHIFIGLLQDKIAAIQALANKVQSSASDELLTALKQSNITLQTLDKELTALKL